MLNKEAVDFLPDLMALTEDINNKHFGGILPLINVYWPTSEDDLTDDDLKELNLVTSGSFWRKADFKDAFGNWYKDSPCICLNTSYYREFILTLPNGEKHFTELSDVLDTLTHELCHYFQWLIDGDTQDGDKSFEKLLKDLGIRNSSDPKIKSTNIWLKNHIKKRKFSPKKTLKKSRINKKRIWF